MARTININVRLNKEEHAVLLKLAEKQERTQSDVMRWLLRRAEVTPVAQQSGRPAAQSQA